MPTAPPIACSTPNCPGRRTSGEPCGTCGKGGKREARKRTDERRGNFRERGYSWEWSKASLAFRRANPLCAECQRQGIVRAATCVDHIVPHKGDQELFWDTDNWQSLCERCHASKSAKE